MKLLVLTLSLVGCITALEDYTLIIHTSNAHGSTGTDDLYIKATLYGELDGKATEMTSPHLDNPGDDFERNAYDTFTFRERDIGQVSCVKIFATSGDDAWNFDSVEVRSTSAGSDNVVLKPLTQDKALSGPGDDRSAVVHELKMCVDQETYNVRIHTSNNDRWAGTDDLVVTMEIIGEKGKVTSPRLDGPGDDFERNHYDTYVFAEENVGTIRCVKLMIASGSDGWLMDGVTVTTSPHTQSINLSPESLQWLAGPYDTRSYVESELVICKNKCDVYLNGDFKITSDWELLTIDFEFDHSDNNEMTAIVAGEHRINNLYGSEAQKITMAASETISETESFSQTAGVSVTVGTTFETGVPGIASGEISTEISASIEFSFGTERSVEKRIEKTFNCVAGAKKYVICKALAHKSKIRIPYVQTWRYKKVPSCTVESKGVFEKVAATFMTMLVSESNDGVHFNVVSREVVMLE